MGKIITIDCDNVLCNTTKSFIEYYKIHYGDLVDYESIQKGFLWDNPVFPKFPSGTDKAPYLDFCRYVQKNGLEKPLENSIEVVSELKNKGYELHVLTGRMNQQKEMTHNFLNKYYPNMFEDVHFTNDNTKYEVSKGSVCKSLGSIILLDDFYHNAESLSSVGLPTLLFDAPWNRGLPDKKLIIRIEGRDGVIGNLPIQ